MSNIQFSFYNRSDTATLSGGSWLAGAPLTNLQQTLLSLRARSTNDTASNTRFDVDLGGTSTVVRLFAIARHNCSTAATYRITAGTSSGASDLYDSGTLDVWPAVYLPEDLEWEDDNWWTGQISASEIEGYPISLMHDCGSNIQARYWRLQITDESNADGYIELARLWMGPLWSPQINYDFGVQFGWEPRSVSEYSLGGVRFTEPRPSARVLKLTLNSLSDAEAYGTILDAQRRLGTAAELVVIPDPADTARAIKRNFLAGFRAFDPLTQAFLDAHSASFEMEERL